MSTDKPTVYLWHSKGLGVILLYESGVYYSNQTGGYACLHPAAEGVYVPLNNAAVDQETQLFAYFTGSKWAGWCNEGIDQETADYIDSVLAKSPYTRMLKVNRDRLEDSHEAWIYVKVVRNADDAEIICELGARAGILTWENSD